MSLTSFLEFADNRTKSQSQGVVLFGAFWPGMDNSGIFPQTFAEANEKTDAITTSKTPIMFDQDDVEWLSQFPPQFTTAALAMRYGSLLMWAVDKMKKGEAIPDRAPITFIDRDTNVEFGKGLDGGEGIPLGMDKLIKRLTQARDLEAFYRMKPSERDKYNGGTLGYNLENIFSNSQTGEKFADAYIGMTQLTARQVMEAWRYGMTAGFLRNADPFASQTQFAQVGFGGGAPKKDRAFQLDWDGQPRQQSANGLWLPVRTGEFLGSKVKDVTDKGEAVYRYEREGVPQEVRAFVPAWQPGRLVDSSTVNQYNNLIDEMNRLIQLHGDPNHKSVKTVTDEARSAVQGIRTYDEFDYNVHRFNKEVDEKGRRLYPRLYTHNTTGVGIVQPHTNQPEAIKGLRQDADTIRNYFHIHRGSSAQPITIGPGGDMVQGSSVGQGIKDFIYDLLKKYNDPEGANALNTMYDDIFNVASSYLDRLAGEPLWADTARKLRDKDADPDEKERLYKQTSKDVRKTVKHWTSTLWQLDWGQGTRRQRAARIAKKAKSTGAGVAMQKLELRDELVGGGQGGTKVQGLSDEDLARLQQGRRPGERNAEVRPASPKIGTGALPASVTEMGVGHHIETIKRRAAQLAARSAQLQAGRQSGMGKVDIKEMVASLAQDAQNRTAIFNQFVQAYIFYQIEKGNLDFDMRDAYDWAGDELDKALKGGGVKTEKGFSRLDSLITAEDKALDQELKELKKNILASVDEVKDMVDDKSMSEIVRDFFKEFPMKDLIENPDALKNAYERLNELDMAEQIEDADMRLIKAFLAQAKKHGDAVKGKDSLSLLDKAKHAKHLDDEGSSATSELEGLQTRLQSPEYLSAIAKKPERYEKLKKIAGDHPELPMLGDAVKKVEEIMRGLGQTVAPQPKPKLADQPASAPAAATDKIDPGYFLADPARISAIARNDAFLEKIRRKAIAEPDEPRWQQIIAKVEQMKGGSTGAATVQQKPKISKPRVVKPKQPPAVEPGDKKLSQGQLF